MRLLQLGLLSIASVAVSGSIALAQGLPPGPMVEPVQSWSGLYAGVNVGGAFGDGPVNFGSGDAANFAPALAKRAIVPTLGPPTRGFAGGAQAGYNFQSGEAVYGIEADIQWADASGTATANATVAGFPAILTQATNKLDWFGTLRPRIGVTLGPAVMVYATGGVAFGEVRSSASTLVSGAASCATSALCSAGSVDAIRAGWTAGGGAEYALTRAWSLKFEYLYLSFGRATYTMPSTLTPGAGMQASVNMQESVARIGGNYKF